MAYLSGDGSKQVLPLAKTMLLKNKKTLKVTNGGFGGCFRNIDKELREEMGYPVEHSD